MGREVGTGVECRHLDSGDKGKPLHVMASVSDGST